MSKQKKYYAIRKGRIMSTGEYVKNKIVDSWEECKYYVEGAPGSEYKSFVTRDAAEEYLGLHNPKVNITIGTKEERERIFNKPKYNEKQVSIDTPGVSNRIITSNASDVPTAYENACTRYGIDPEGLLIFMMSHVVELMDMLHGSMESRKINLNNNSGSPQTTHKPYAQTKRQQNGSHESMDSFDFPPMANHGSPDTPPW